MAHFIFSRVFTLKLKLIKWNLKSIFVFSATKEVIPMNIEFIYTS